MKIELDLQDKELIEFLKTFSDNHKPGSKDNLCTDRPIHLVQTKRYEILPYDEDVVCDWLDWEECFLDGYDNDEFEDEVELVKSFGEHDNPRTFLDLYSDWTLAINTYDDYFKYYEIVDVTHCMKKSYWETKAYFLIREEAEKYIKYQSHNLGECRIYTDSHGYSNNGEWTKFYDLLLDIGDKVKNREDEGYLSKEGQQEYGSIVSSLYEETDLKIF